MIGVDLPGRCYTPAPPRYGLVSAKPTGAPYVGHRLGPAHSTDEVEVVDVLEHVLEVAQLP